MLLGCDLTAQVPDVIAILRNEEATAFNQDPLGIQATMVSSVNVSNPERYMIMGHCDATESRQLGWSISPDGLIRTDQHMCISTLWPMFEAVLSPCNASDIRQQWIYNVSRGNLVTKQQFAEQPACLMTSFAHAMRGSSVSVAICRANGPHWGVTKAGQLTTAAGSNETLSREGKQPATCVVRTDQTPIEAALGIGQLQVFAGRITDGFGAALVNVDTVAAHNITLSWERDLGLSPSKQIKVRDVYRRKDLGTFSNEFAASVEPHDTVLLRLEEVV